MADLPVVLGAPPIAPVVAGPVVAGPGSAPQLPCGADQGSICGWMLKATSSETSNETSLRMERGFERIASLPATTEGTFATRLSELVEEVVNSDSFDTYLIVSPMPHAVPRVTVIHSIRKYSAGFGVTNVMHGQIVRLLGEMTDVDQLLVAAQPKQERPNGWPSD